MGNTRTKRETCYENSGGKLGKTSRLKRDCPLSKRRVPSLSRQTFNRYFQVSIHLLTLVRFTPKAFRSSGERERLNSAKDKKTRCRENGVTETILTLLSTRCDRIRFSRVRSGDPIRLPSRTAVAFVFVCKSTFLLHEKLKTSRPASGIVIVPSTTPLTRRRPYIFYSPLSTVLLPRPTSRSVWSINTRQTHIHTAGKRSVGTTTSRPLFTVLRRCFPPPPLLCKLVCVSAVKNANTCCGTHRSDTRRSPCRRAIMIYLQAFARIGGGRGRRR